MKDFTVWLLNELDQRDWKPADLARRAGFSTGALSHILNGTRNPGLDTLTSIAHALNLPVDQVLRKAGAIPPLPAPDSDPTLRELAEFSRALNAAERRRLLGVARLYLAEQNARYYTSNNDDSNGLPTTLPA